MLTVSLTRKCVALDEMSIDLHSQPCSNASCRTVFTSAWPIAGWPTSHYRPYLYVWNEWQVLTNELQNLTLNERAQARCMVNLLQFSVNYFTAQQGFLENITCSSLNSTLNFLLIEVQTNNKLNLYY